MNRLLSLGLSVSQEATVKPAPKPEPKQPSSQPPSGGRPPQSKPLPHPAHLLFAPSIQRPRRFVLPTRYESSYRYPLVIWLHSDGDNENQISRVLPHLSTRNYIGVGIRGSRSADAAGHCFDWTFGSAAVARGEDAVFQAIEDAQDRYSIHPERLFLAGYGSGGTMARRIALRHGRAFAGCLALGGRFPDAGGMYSNLAVARQVKHFWAVACGGQVNEADFEADIQRAAAARLRMDVRRYTVDDVMVREVLRDADRWIMSQVTGTAAQESWNSSPVGFSEN